VSKSDYSLSGGNNWGGIVRKEGIKKKWRGNYIPMAKRQIFMMKLR
jgi:hypothetical protein